MSLSMGFFVRRKGFFQLAAGIIAPIILIGSLLCLPLKSAHSESEIEAPITGSGFYFDTSITYKLYGASESIVAEINELCEYYEKLLSKTIEGSDVWRINHSNGTPIEVSDHTINILKTAQEFAELTGGAFDITIEPIMALWDFTNGRMPSQQKINETLPLVNYKKLIINQNCVTLAPGMAIDLGGIAKGYICDRIADYCKNQGIVSGFLNFGGNVITIGTKPEGTQWVIGIDDPQTILRNSSIIAILSTNQSIVTSGTYQRGFTLDGVRYHHIIDPSTGYPVNNNLTSLTIVAPSSFYGDVLSTACFVLGMDKAISLLNTIDDTEGLFIDTNNNIYYTKGLEDFLLEVK